MKDKICPDGKILNFKTGRCINKPKSPKKKECPPNKILNPTTGRCINKPKSPKKKECPPNKILNPKTGRCINKPKCIDCNKIIYNIKYKNKCYNCNLKNKKIDKNLINIEYTMKKNIIDNLKIIKEYEEILGNKFKVNSYNKAIDILELYENEIKNINDINNLKGIGNKIIEKIKEYINTGKIEKVLLILKDDKYILNKKINKIYGIGPAKIKELMNKITKYDDLFLPENENLLNKKQQIGLKYAQQLDERIPYNEGKKHFNIIKENIESIYKNIEFEMVGSYRRKNIDLGDIDILIKNNGDLKLSDFINKMISNNYIIETLANGKKKFMGICKLNDSLSARRIDILLCDVSNYYFTLLYFTGSYKFNIEMRKNALKKGMSLSEYGFTDINTKKILNFDIKSEEDIFKIIDMEYVKPENRY